MDSGMDLRVMVWNQCLHFSPISGTRLHSDSSAEKRCSLFHACQPKRWTAGPPLLDLVPIKANAVIKDIEADSLLLKVYMDIHMSGLSMFNDIIQTFLNNSKNSDLHGIIQVAFVSMDIHPDVKG